MEMDGREKRTRRCKAGPVLQAFIAKQIDREFPFSQPRAHAASEDILSRGDLPWLSSPMAFEGIPMGAEDWRIAWPVALAAFEKLNKEDITKAVLKLESQIMNQQRGQTEDECCCRCE